MLQQLGDHASHTACASLRAEARRSPAHYLIVKRMDAACTQMCSSFDWLRRLPVWRSKSLTSDMYCVLSHLYSHWSPNMGNVCITSFTKADDNSFHCHMSANIAYPWPADEARLCILWHVQGVLKSLHLTTSWIQISTPISTRYKSKQKYADPTLSDHAQYVLADTCNNIWAQSQSIAGNIIASSLNLSSFGRSWSCVITDFKMHSKIRQPKQAVNRLSMSVSLCQIAVLWLAAKSAPITTSAGRPIWQLW